MERVRNAGEDSYVGTCREPPEGSQRLAATGGQT